MATSGTLGTLSGSWGSTYTVTWVLLSQSVANNTSTIRLTATFSTTNTTKIASTYSTFVLDGTTVYSGAYSKSGAGTIFSKTKDITVTHNADGTFPGRSVSFSTNDYIMGSKSGSGTISGVTTIPRASSFTLSGSALGSVVTVTISRASNSFTHKVEYAIGNSGYTTVDSSAATTASFTPLTATYASQNTAGTSVTCTVRVTTLNGGTQIGSSTKSISLSIPSSVVPTFTGLSFTRIDNGVPSSWGVYVQGYSKVTAAITGASGIYGSTISGYYISGAGKTSNSSSLTSDVLTSNGNNYFSAYVKDSRGRQSATQTSSIYVYPYSAPSVRVTAHRCTSDGTISSSGTYLKVTCTYSYASVNGKNSITSKSVSCNGASNTSFTSGEPFILAANCAIGSSYTLTATVKDGMGKTATVSITIPTAERVMNVRSNGKGAAFGGFASKDNAVQFFWDIYLANNTVPFQFRESLGNSGTNLNSLTSQGFYVQYSNANASTSLNYPVAKAGLLTVGYSNSSNYVFQTYHVYDNSGFYYRTCYSGTWYAWQRCAPVSEAFTNTASRTANTVLAAPNGSAGAASFRKLVAADIPLHNHNGSTWCNNWLFNSTAWIGIYSAYGSGTRWAWIGHNGTNTLNINNEKNNYMCLQASSSNIMIGPEGIYPENDNTRSCGWPTKRWNTVYAKDGTISTSDRNLKKDISDLNQKYIELFNKLKPIQYKFKDKNSNRIHIGFVSQDVKEAMDEVGLSDLDFAGYCRDVKRDQNQNTGEWYDVLDDDGNKQYIYSLRYEEFIALNTHMTQKAHKKINEQQSVINAQQKEIDDLKSQVQELKELVLAMSKKEE